MRNRLVYNRGMEPVSLHPPWLELASPRVDDLVNTAKDEALAHFDESQISYHCLYYDLECSGNTSAPVAEFVRAGLPEDMPLSRDGDWILFCNWPREEERAGRAGVYRTSRDVIGVDHSVLADDFPNGAEAARRWASVRTRKALEDRDFYLAEAWDEGRIEYDMPLNIDTATRLLRKDQQKFRRVFDALLVDTDAKSRARAFKSGGVDRWSGPAYEALHDLTEVANRIIPLVRQGQFAPDGRADFHPVEDFAQMLDYLPNSVTWAWRRLFDEVNRAAVYAHCQNPACGRTFERSQPRKTYCSRSCASRHRQQRYRERQAGGRTG